MFGLLQRRQCDACGSKLIRHFPNAQDIFLVLPLSERNNAYEGYTFDGEAVASWMCGHCNNYGFLFQGHFGM